MATATSAKDDDLLIISDDDSENNSDEMDFSFDFSDESKSQAPGEENTAAQDPEKDEKSASQDDMILDFTQTESSSQKKPEASETSETTSQEDSASSDMQVAQGEENITPEKAPESENKNADSAEETLDFSFAEDETQAQTADTPVQEDPSAIVDSHISQESEGTESMNEILTATITKLETRKQSIASDKSEKEKHEAEIKSEIKKLEDEYGELEAEIKSLDSEDEKITANIAQLEKMKLDPVKEHNAKRTVKK